jgi:hypothetical protein
MPGFEIEIEIAAVGDLLTAFDGFAVIGEELLKSI